MKLRDYQTDAIICLNHRIGEGQKKIGLQLPTGTGKTLIAGEFLKPHLANGKRAVFIVPQVNLAEQTAESFAHLGTPEIIQGTRKYSANNNLYVATIQSLRKRDDIGKIDFLIWDEAHDGMTGKSIQQVMSIHNESTLIALTATMYDAEGKIYDEHFDSVIRQHSIPWYIDHGYLCPIKIYSPVTPNLSGVKKVGNDYNQKQLAEVMSESSLITKIADKTIDFVVGKKTFVFGVTIKHAEILCDEYKSLGIKAETYHSNTQDRPQLLQDFKDGKVEMLCSVMSLTKGVDVPAVDCLVVARPTQSASLWRQIVGRAMRPLKGKSYATVIDCGNIVNRLGHPYDVPKIKESNEGFKGLSCPSCNSTFIKLISTEALSAGARSAGADPKIFEVVKTYECKQCHDTFRRVVESETTVCEQCDSAIHKANTRIHETEEDMTFISICPECEFEKPYRTVPLVDAELQLFHRSTSRSDLEPMAQAIALRMSDYLKPDDMKYVVDLLSNVMKSSFLLMTSAIISRIGKKLETKELSTSDIDAVVLEESIEHFNLCLLTYDKLDEAYHYTKDISILILSANEIYRRSRPGFQASRQRISDTIETFVNSNISQTRLLKSTRTKIKNMFDRGHKMSSLIYFIDWLEDQDRIEVLRDAR